MSVKNILKGAGKALNSIKENLDDIGGYARHTFEERRKNKQKYTVGPGQMFERLHGKHLSDPNAMYQQVLPYQLNSKYSVPLMLGAVGITAAGVAFDNHNRAQMGKIVAGEGLSSMSIGGIEGASANVITPGLKKLQDASTASARKESASVRNNMMHNITTRGAEGDIVFALHNMR